MKSTKSMLATLALHPELRQHDCLFAGPHSTLWSACYLNSVRQCSNCCCMGVCVCNQLLQAKSMVVTTADPGMHQMRSSACTSLTRGFNPLLATRASCLEHAAECCGCALLVGSAGS